MALRKKLLTPFQQFVQIESLGGVLLLAATVVALVWANSGWSDTYQALWERKLGVQTESFSLVKPLILWINDGLMAIFFFLIGLEIKRELLIGELNSLRKATFPIVAAIGGIVVPLGVYLLLNDQAATRDGWGIPMATDIAFSLAIVKALGRAAPLGLKVFLTAFAIVDDLCAVCIIAIFYSSGIAWPLIGGAAALLAVLFALSARGIYVKYLTLALGVIIWYLFLKAGIHPTIAGVLLAFTVPIRRRLNVRDFFTGINASADRLMEAHDPTDPLLTPRQVSELGHLERLVEEVQSPLQRLEHQFHGWVAYFIMPVFALANAGVVLSGDMELETGLILSIAAALFVGKLTGISLFSFLAVKLGLAELPAGVSPLQVVGVAALAGLGFTMAIFIANLAFAGQPALIDSAKIGILIGSVVAAATGAALIWYGSRRTVGGADAGAGVS